MSNSNHYNIDYTAHYFIPLDKIDSIVPCMGIAIYSFDDTVLVECTISESLYGKIGAVPVGYENGLYPYRPETFYVDDFNSLLHKGAIIKKESPTQHVERIDEWEPLTNNTHIVHSSYAVVD